jgi:hypothetical protein
MMTTVIPLEDPMMVCSLRSRNYLADNPLSNQRRYEVKDEVKLDVLLLLAAFSISFDLRFQNYLYKKQATISFVGIPL